MASQPKIPQPRRIPAHRWQVRFPPAAREGEHSQLEGSFDLDYAPALAELDRLGFDPVYRVKSIPHSRLGRRHAEDPDPGLEEFILWHHPAGVMVRTKSYTKPAGKDWLTGQHKPRRIKLDTLSIDVEVDSGAGPELAHIAAVKIRGGGTSKMMLDGTERHLKNTEASRGGETSFRGFLEACQAHGRFVPVAGWTRESRIYIPAEMLLPVCDPAPWRHQDFEESLKKNPAWLEEGRRALERALPEALRHTLGAAPDGASQEGQAHGLGDPAPPRGRDMEWTRVEYAHRQVAEALFMGRQRFPPPPVRAQVQHWMEVALGYHGEDPSCWRAWEEGPAGVSLATILLFSNHHAPAHARLLRLIQAAPPGVLERWLTKPDAAGYVLGQRVLQRAFRGSCMEPADATADRLVDVLRALVDKMGVDRIVLETPMRSALGLWMQQRPIANDSERREASKHQACAAQVMAAFEGMGVEWISPLRGRNYPNTFTDDDRVLAFFEHPLPQAADGFCKLLGERLAPESKPFLDLLDARLRAHAMAEHLPVPAASPARPRF